MIGKTISRYKISDKLGEGGMGVVYKAEDTRLKRSVALKFPSREVLGSEEEKARFLREAQAAAALEHSNICTTYEIDEFEGQPFIAMAYIDGQSLEKKLKSGPLSIDEAVNVAIQIAEGLDEAHEKGIIHRDIKSANIMLTRKGQVKIMDFGLAKLLGRTRLTRTATVMGTVAYMSPEQALGESVDHRTDIWSLGVVFYEMLTGRVPFTAPNDAALIHKIIYDELPEMTGPHPEIPPGLSYVVKRAMKKNTGERYANISELLHDIRNYDRLQERESELLADRAYPQDQAAYTRAEKRLKAELRFYRHLAFFVGLNALLIFINLVTSTGYFWFIWPLLGLSFILFLHWVSVFPLSKGSSIRKRMLEEELNRQTGKRP